MAQSLSAVYIHLIFSTKNRHPFLQDAAIRDRVFRFVAAASGKLDCPVKVIGGMPDHVHILAQLGKEITLKDWIKEIKRTSSLMAKTLGTELQNFAWQRGYGAFSVSQSGITEVIRYINEQEEHHKTMTFQQELVQFLKKYQIPYDERYLWD